MFILFWNKWDYYGLFVGYDGFCMGGGGGIVFGGGVGIGCGIVGSF